MPLTSLPFLRSFLLDPRGIGSVTPSSPKLCQFIASAADPANSHLVEIGAGTGAITRALLAEKVRPERLLVIERDPALVAVLQKNFPQLRIRCGDAVHLNRILAEESIHHVSTIVSSLPLYNLTPRDLLKTAGAMVRGLGGDGQLIQYSYRNGCPIPAHRFGLQAECLGLVWQNLPPARVWRFTIKAQ